MFIIASDIIINMNAGSAAFINNKGHFQVDVSEGAYTLEGAPSNALAQVAVAIAEGKTFVEFENAKIVVETEVSNDIGSDIE